MDAEEFRSLRKAAGLTQAGFARVLHLTPAFVGEMERREKAIEPRTAELARWSLGRRISVGTFGERYTVVLSQPTVGSPGRSHTVLPQTYGSYAEAEARAQAFCDVNAGWSYVKRPAVVSRISCSG
jgi:transcriptional regulator with XRE-family HTH domain